ncbi:hypothetical protein [Clostridium sp.]|uniref:hypothetical protein n=1 Tax=Clostridium sp. TaxID=1506 RepID=UPI003217CFBC
MKSKESILEFNGIDLAGKRFGKLRVVNLSYFKIRGKNRVGVWKCICDCKNEVEVVGDELRNGESKSCGCLKKDSSKTKFQTLGKNNVSGITGVGWSKVNGKWRSRITLNRKVIHLGYFESFEDAVEARRNAEKMYFEEYIERYNKIVNN